MIVPRKSWIEPVFLVVAFCCAAILVVIFPPETSGFYPQCLFKAATGWLCPGCGGTRALHSLATGEFQQALSLNPLIFVFLSFLLLRLYVPFTKATARLEKKRAYTFGLIIFLIAFTLIRNSG